MNNDVLKALEVIDASVFSGDTFHAPEDRDFFRKYVDRWSKEIEEMTILRWHVACLDEGATEVAVAIAGENLVWDQLPKVDKDQLSWWLDTEVEGFVSWELLTEKAPVDELGNDMVFLQLVQDDCQELRGIIDQEDCQDEFVDMDKFLNMDGKWIDFTKPSRQASKELYDKLLRQSA